MARDSEFFREFAGENNSRKVGPDVSERLVKARVMVGDAWSDAAVGRIALIPAGKGRRVKLGRFYA
jgi:hypothetical protein